MKRDVIENFFANLGAFAPSRLSCTSLTLHITFFLILSIPKPTLTMTPTSSIGPRILTILHYLGAYFIAVVLLLFAISKFFNGQFQIYEYAGFVPLNETPLMTHAWSFFGRSYNYNLFLGIVEFMTGVLIVFPRTRLAALLLALGLFVNILIIDIEFKVTMALGHVIVETIIVLLMLIPYLGKIKKFLWDKSEERLQSVKKIWSLYVPLLFIAGVSTFAVFELKSVLADSDPDMGPNKINHVILNNDTLNIQPGKYTREPMLFFEFGNLFILSANDKTLWADYSRKGDSISIKFDKDFEGSKTLSGRIDHKTGKMTGSTDKGAAFEISFSKVKAGYKK